MQKYRQLLFLRDVLVLACTAFGGPQVHFTMFLQKLVHQRRYLTEEELLELQALCQILPGPTSTQTITAVGFRIGKAKLAYLTLLVWILPAMLAMTALALLFHHFQLTHIHQSLTRFIEPMAVAFVAWAAFSMGEKVIKSKTSWTLLILSAILSFLVQSPYLTPIIILAGGLVSSFKFRQQQKMKKEPIRIEWSNLILWLSVLIISAVLGKITQSLHIRLFENFYRNGSIVFGGGHVLSSILYTEFVEFKQYLNQQEFLTGIAFSQTLPGPVFSIASWIGVLSMKNAGIQNQILGSLVSTIGIFLPGAFLIFFTIRFWEQLKKYRGIRASLEGINAVSIGLTASVAVSLFLPMVNNFLPIFIFLLTLLILKFTKIQAYWLILLGILAGFLFA